jgi:autotransporter-associated beta strand protein
LGGTLTITNGAATVSNNTFEVRFVGGGFDFTRPLVLDGGVGEGNAVQLFLGNSNAAPAQTFSGVISGNGRLRRSGVVVSDAGTTILTAANTYSGGTVVFAGTLLANNASGSATGPGAVLVTNLGTLGGTGTIAGPVTVMTNGSVAPGQSAGNLTLQNGFDASAGGTYVWELAANSTSGPGVNFDTVTVTGGAVVLGGSSKLALAFGGSATTPHPADAFWQSPRTWTILRVQGGASNPGATAFATITNSYAAGTFTNYAAPDGSIVLAFTPAAAGAAQITGGTRLNDGNFALTFSGPAGQDYSVRASTNAAQSRASWPVLTSGTFSGTPVTYSDLGATNFPRRFYLISLP